MQALYLLVQIVSAEYLYYTGTVDALGPAANSHVTAAPVNGVLLSGP